MKFEKMSSLGTFFGVVAAAVALSCGGCGYTLPEGALLICQGDVSDPKVLCLYPTPQQRCFLTEAMTFQSCKEKKAYGDLLPYRLVCTEAMSGESCQFTLPGNYPEASLSFSGTPPKTKSIVYEGGVKKVTVTF